MAYSVSAITAERLWANHNLLLHRKLDESCSPEHRFLCGAVLQYGEYFQCSPNVDWMEEVPQTGSREVFMRSDNRYADDDYIQWPQPCGLDYYAAIPRSSQQDPLLDILFKRYREDSEDILSSGSHFTALAATDVAAFDAVYSGLQPRLEEYLARSDIQQDPETLKYVVQIRKTLAEAFLARLKGQPMTAYELRRCIAELQRFSLELIAALDFDLVFRRRIQGLDPPAAQADEHRMGTFTQDPIVVASCIKPASLCSISKIDFLVFDEHRAKYPVIFKGKATDPRRLLEIFFNSRHVLHSANIFACNYNPPPTPSRWPDGVSAVLGAMRTAMTVSRLGITLVSQFSPSALYVFAYSFADKTQRLSATQQSSLAGKAIAVVKPVTAPVFPSIIPSWLRAFNSIDKHLFPANLPSDRGYAFANPSLVFDAERESVKTDMVYRWLQVRDVMIFRVGPAVPTNLRGPVSSRTWRRALQLQPSDIQAIRQNQSQSRSATEKQEGLAFLESAIQAAGDEVDTLLLRPAMWRGTPYASPSALDETVLKEVIFELSELNFRNELLALDRHSCTLANPNSFERHELILDCLVPPPFPRAFLVIIPHQASSGLGHSEIRQRVPQLNHLRNLMQAWKEPFTAFDRLDENADTSYLLRMEQMLYTFYVRCIKLSGMALVALTTLSPSIHLSSTMFAKLRAAGEKAMREETVHSSHAAPVQATSRVIDPQGRVVSSDSFVVQQPAPIPLRPPSVTLPAVPDSESASSNNNSSTIPPPPTDEPKPEEPQSQLFRDFEAKKDKIAEILFKQNTADGLGQPCPCGVAGATRTTMCRECWHYSAACSQCFVKAHIHSPTHWAEVWSPDRGFFLRHDISALPDNPHIYLGHGGAACSNAPLGISKETFTIVDINGIHTTKVQFCSCGAMAGRAEQLLNAGLFPATFRRPRMAFTFAVLRNFHKHHLTSSQSAYDYVSALRHLTDGFFFKDAANPYDQFRDVFKMYRVLEAEMRLGQCHGIDQFFPNRPPGSLALLCPACIEVGVNTTQAERDLCDPCLKHVYQMLFTADGNFQANHYIKNNDPKSISLFRGRAYFPSDPQYRVFATRTKKAGPGTEQKTTCSYLNAINKQEKKKFLGYRCIGCSEHSMPPRLHLEHAPEAWSRFLNTDYARRHAILQRGIPSAADLENLSGLFSYDIGCHYGVNANERFSTQADLADVASLVEKFEYTVPLVHVSNHKDNCIKQRSSLGPYFNEFGGQGRQMSNGTRQDMYNDIATFWNRMKEVGLAAQLYNDLMRAAELKERKLLIFLRYCKSYADKVAEWNKRPRDEIKYIKKEVDCVYRHKPSKLPSRSRIYQALVQKAESEPGKLIDDSSEVEDVPRPSQSKSLPRDPKSIPLLLNHSISVRNLQQKIISTRKAYALHETPTMKTKLASLRKRLNKDLAHLRDLQSEVTPQVAEEIEDIPSNLANDTPEDQPLYLPSDYNDADRTTKGLTKLGALEYDILQGAAYDTLAKLRAIVRLLSSMRTEGKKHDYGQERHTRTKSQLIDATVKFETCMGFYNTIRRSLISLGLPDDDPTFKELTEKDTFRKATTETRGPGDTYKADGLLWTGNAIDIEHRLTHRPLVNAQATSAVDTVGTASSQPMKRAYSPGYSSRSTDSPIGKNQPRNTEESTTSKKPRTGNGSTSTAPEGVETVPRSEGTTDQEKPVGWLWDIKSSASGVTDEDVEAFLSEGKPVFPLVARSHNQYFRCTGNRVQWFRAEADLTRWQEEWERKLIEFLRTIRYYDKMTDVWGSLARLNTSSPGKAAAAMKTSKRYQELRRRCEDVFRQAGYVYRRSLSTTTNDAGNTTTTRQSETTTMPEVDEVANADAMAVDEDRMSGDSTSPMEGITGDAEPSSGACQVLEDDTIIPFIQAARATLNATLAKAIASPGTIAVLAAYPTKLVSGPRGFLVRTVVGAGASACLSAIWGLVGIKGTLGPEVRQPLMMRLLDMRDSVFGWSRICLQHELPFIPQVVTGKARPTRLDLYLSQARILLQLLASGEDFSLEMLTSSSFADLFLELWTAEENPDSTGTDSHRIVDSVSDACPIVDLLTKIAFDDHGRDNLISQCNRTAQSDEFCIALIDRITSGWEREPISFFGWIGSMNQLIRSALALRTSSSRLHKILARNGYLAQFASELKAYVRTMDETPDLRRLLALAISPLLGLAQLALQGEAHSRMCTSWGELQSGEYLSALLLASSGIGDEENRDAKYLLAVITKTRENMAYPREFGKGTIPRLEIEKFAHLPELMRSWNLLIDAHNTAATALKRLQARPLVYFCDNLPCALSGKDITEAPKECAGCSSVVYCSEKCQREDWEKSHRHECGHARELHAEKQRSDTWYNHEIRASQAALLEVIYEATLDGGIYDSGKVYPIYDCVLMPSISGDVCIDGTGKNYFDDPLLQTYLRPRLDCLMKMYTGRDVPPGWRLAVGIFPMLGSLAVARGESPIQLTVLLKPEACADVHITHNGQGNVKKPPRDPFKPYDPNNKRRAPLKARVVTEEEAAKNKAEHEERVKQAKAAKEKAEKEKARAEKEARDKWLTGTFDKLKGDEDGFKSVYCISRYSAPSSEAMSRSSAIPPHVLVLADSGDPGALKRLAGLLTPGNVTVQIVELVFKNLTSKPAPHFPFTTSRHRPVLSPTVAANPSASLTALWKLTAWRKKLKVEVRSVLDERLMECADSVLRWARVCLQSGWPCAFDHADSGRHTRNPHMGQYFSLAKTLLQFRNLDDDYALALYSSKAFVDLFLELWLTDERCHRTDAGGLEFYRMVDTEDDDGCPIVSLADSVLSNSDSRDSLLSQLTDIRICRQFALALTDRVARGWEAESLNLLNWILSLNSIASVTMHLYESSPILCECLTQIGYLPELAAQLASFAETVKDDSPPVYALVTLLAPALIKLAQLTTMDGLPFSSREIWSQLRTGHYIDALFHSAVLASQEGYHDHSESILAIVDNMGYWMAYPRVSARMEVNLEIIDVEELASNPEAYELWTLFVHAYARALEAVNILEQRPVVYFCDHLECALSGERHAGPSKECGACHAVVYCSALCQKRDWDERHRHECNHARALYSARVSSHSWYDSKTRASQAALLEIPFAEQCEVGPIPRDIRTEYNVLDCRTLESLDEDSYVEDLAEAISGALFKRTYFRPRLESLFELCRSGAVPEGWALVEGIFHPIGDEEVIRLTALMKPTGNTYHTVYCVHRYE
ncbi:hypothetical protein NMY22_g12366 [Coprinellus aureogranulatus]|nr:hypothetical protein NMY22_g12366 [Coprinellus aureogranulatus]